MQTRKIEIEIPENAYQALGDVALVEGVTVEKELYQMVCMMLECDLTGGGDVPDKVGQFICKKHNFDPKAWRTEA